MTTLTADIDRLTAQAEATERAESAQAPPHGSGLGDQAGSAQAPLPGTEAHHPERSAQALSPEVIAAVLRHLAATQEHPEISAQARSPGLGGEAGDANRTDQANQQPHGNWSNNWYGDWNRNADPVQQNDPWAPAAALPAVLPAAQPAPAASSGGQQEQSWGQGEGWGSGWAAGAWDTWSQWSQGGGGTGPKYFDKGLPPTWDGLHPEKTWRDYRRSLDHWITRTDIPGN